VIPLTTILMNNHNLKNLSFSQGKRSHSQDIFFRKFLMTTKKKSCKKLFFLNKHTYIFLDAVSESLLSKILLNTLEMHRSEIGSKKDLEFKSLMKWKDSFEINLFFNLRYWFWSVCIYLSNSATFLVLFVKFSFCKFFCNVGSLKNLFECFYNCCNL
jgi:hypothetical protein